MSTLCPLQFRTHLYCQLSVLLLDFLIGGCFGHTQNVVIRFSFQGNYRQKRQDANEKPKNCQPLPAKAASTASPVINQHHPQEQQRLQQVRRVLRCNPGKHICNCSQSEARLDPVASLASLRGSAAPLSAAVQPGLVRRPVSADLASSSD